MRNVAETVVFNFKRLTDRQSSAKAWEECWQKSPHFRINGVMITLVANAGLSKQFEHYQDKELCKKNYCMFKIMTLLDSLFFTASSEASLS